MTFPFVQKNTSDCVYLLIGSPFLLTERKLLSPMQGKNNYCTCCYYLLLLRSSIFPSISNVVEELRSMFTS